MNFLNSAAVLSLHIFEADFQKKESIFVPKREFHSLTFRKSGAVSICADGKTVLSQAPSVTFVPKGTSYHTEILQSGSMIAVHFTLSEKKEQERGVTTFTPPRPEVLSSLFSSLFEHYKIDNPRDYTAMSLFYEILSVLESANFGIEKKGLSKRMVKAKEYIEKSFSDPFLSVQKTAEYLGISQVYFRKEWKAEFGTLPSDYIKHIRFEHAKAMLKTGYYSVGEVAEKCGFWSLSYFSAAFHKQFGINPSDYIKQIHS